MVTVMAVLLAVIVSLIRWSRWLGFTQEKEYRLDRLWQFWRAPEGRAEWLRVVPHWRDFTRTGFKRPVRTPRVMVVATTSLVVIVAIGGFSWWLTGQWWLGWLLVYVLLPLWLVVAVFPTFVISEVMTRRALQRAARLVRQHHPLVIGVGGAYGKTSTKHLLHHVLNSWQPTFTTPKSYNTRLSVAHSILQQYQGQPLMIIEYGAYTFGEITEIAQWFPPHLAIETGYTEQHLSLFGSTRGIIKAESELVAALPSNGVCFCHAADEGALKIAETGAKVSGVDIIPYSGEAAGVKLHHLKLNPQGQLEFTWRGWKVQTQLVGTHYAVNIQGVITIASYLGMPEKEMIKAIESFQPNERFVRSWQTKKGVVVIDDGFSTNPVGMLAGLELAQTLRQAHQYHKVVLVFGGIVDLGELSATVHRRLAKAAQTVADEVWYSGQVGRAQFVEVLGEDKVVTGTTMTEKFSQLEEETLVLIEGRIPADLSKVLSQK